MKPLKTLVFLLLFTNLLNAQSNDYDSLWKKVIAFEADGLPKSALAVVEDISDLAKKEHNTPQHIKALLHKSKYALTLEEDAQLKVINDFKSEIDNSETPTKNLLDNMLATLYWQYFQQNRYQFYNRTHTEAKVDVTDFRTWDLQTLFEEIHIHYQNSLKSGLILQQTKLDSYDEILLKTDGSKRYRPTLFDLLSHNALEFYQTNENSITKPAYKFQIDQADYLASAETFSRLKISSKDSTSLQLNALIIYEDLIKFHLKDNDPFALADVDLERLKFVYEHASFDEKEQQFLNTLQTSRDYFGSHEVSGLYAFEIANLYLNQGNSYVPKVNEDVRWKTKEALELCNSVIDSFPKSKGAEKCLILKSRIEQPSLELTTEDYLPLQQHSRILVGYKNFDQLHFNLYKVSRNQLKAFHNIYRKDEQLSFIKKLNTSIQWQSALHNENDYQTHSTEVVVPKLGNGTYIVLAMPKIDDDSTFAFSTIQVTDLALVESENQYYKIFQIIDRNNGKPIKNAKVELSFNKNNNPTILKEQLTSNDYGEVKIEKNNDRYRNLSLKANYGKDTAYFGTYYINSIYVNEKISTNYNSFLFTDRSIYRPGQTLYFKGIAMKTKDRKSEVLANEPVYVTLYNVNDEEVSELEFVTNEFGSVHGEFILPSNGLTGQYYLEMDGDNHDMPTEHYFSVEDYKRPKFEAKFNPITETFKVNDSVTVKGTALAYAGSNITDAKVVYRVKRNVQFPRWYYWSRPWFNSEAQEISFGETQTNDKGEFNITFKALPDTSVDKAYLPVFHYEITADVTDLNGETRSATTIVNVGYHALTAHVSVKTQLDKTKKDHHLTIDTKNLNGEFVPASGTIKIYKLKAPNQVLRKRPWNAPDYQMLSEAEFKALFPHDAYENEDDPNTWEKGILIFESNFNTDQSKELALGNIKKWPSGQYVVILESKDKFGQLVKDEAKTTLYSDEDSTLADAQLFNVSHKKSSYSVGDQVVLTLGSAAKELFVTVAIEKNFKIVNTYIIHLKNNKKTIHIPVNKADLGGFAVHTSFSAFNDFHSSITPISVPYPSTDLSIETLTFRDKLQPGTDETWSFKIKGPKGNQVSAELLASMYDASLDQFRTHSWQFNPIENPSYYTLNQRHAGNNFGTKNFRVYLEPLTNYEYPRNYYDELNWFGFRFGNSRQIYYNHSNVQYANVESSVIGSADASIPDNQIKGIIYAEDGIPLPGANIIKKGSTIGTQSDFDGNFNIQAKKGDVLVFSFVGYKTLEVKIASFNSLSITLIPDSAHLDEVVVTAYGVSMQKKSLSDAVGYVPAEEMESDMEELVVEPDEQKKETNFDNIQIRKNLQETAFFFPQLQTDSNGNVSFSFTTPEALTKWKLQLLAHTKTLESTTKTLETVTQKELMVIPNAPRFLRQGDTIVISTKIANLTEQQLNGLAKLMLTDAVSGKEIDAKLNNSDHTKSFTVEATANTQVSWSISIPDDISAVQYKIVAKSGDFSDGEQNALPVLTNRMLVTETLPMWIKSNETRTFTLDKLKTNTSSTLKHHKLTLEVTSNPAWYAVQALPYLMEYPYECNEQTFSRYYANALASHIANSNPRIQEVFNQWKNNDALLSNLEKNQELKSILIQETPWLRDAQSETEQKKRIALLFDMNKMTHELESAIGKLQQNQMSNGAWPWFNGGRENRYITQHIISGFGHLKKLNVKSNGDETKMIQKAIAYLDSEFVQEYKDIRKYDSKVDLSKDHLSHTQLHYLYMRSFFPEMKASKEVDDIMNYYHSQIKNYWLSRSLYSKGLMALVVDRMGDKATSSKILKSLKENSITNDELGMYWKENTSSWYWYQAPIETQALLIEAFTEIEKDTKTIDNLKIWLLKNKQTNQWKTTKATAEAVYALLLQGSDWLSVTEMVDVVLGGETISPTTLENVKVEAGTGYYKTSWHTSEIKPKMAEVKLTKKGDGIAWGSLYWQYFEDLDKITSAETPLKLKKKLFLKTNTDKGEQISEISEDTHLKVGDLVRVRIELRSDRAMEFVHMKDMRAAGLEPINVLSQYKWQDGLGYYESTKDASTNFFFDYLPKGVFVFEYDLRVNNAGAMSNGITTIQSMYAPEFSSHSEGVRIQVK
ncbi:alpha-2-macroglobulin family protein [Flavobacteriaceae bacterium MAR_2010_105]|nr:alpha-2-macroglobulin family protein [Flavobacteriaceae bacterium MAR_2010_105]